VRRRWQPQNRTTNSDATVRLRLDHGHRIAGVRPHYTHLVTNRGDTFDNAEHTAASGIDCSTYARFITADFTLTDDVLTVTV
jgi:hypothetical protein